MEKAKPPTTTLIYCYIRFTNRRMCRHLLTYRSGEFAGIQTDITDVGSQETVHFVRKEIHPVWNQVLHRVSPILLGLEGRHPCQLDEVVVKRGLDFSQGVALAVQHLSTEVPSVLLSETQKTCMHVLVVSALWNSQVQAGAQRKNSFRTRGPFVVSQSELKLFFFSLQESDRLAFQG